MISAELFCGEMSSPHSEEVDAPCTDSTNPLRAVSEYPVVSSTKTNLFTYRFHFHAMSGRFKNINLAIYHDCKIHEKLVKDSFIACFFVCFEIAKLENFIYVNFIII